MVVGVTEHEGYVVDAFAIHVVNGIAATTAYTDDFDDAMLVFGAAEVEYSGTIGVVVEI